MLGIWAWAHGAGPVGCGGPGVGRGGHHTHLLMYSPVRMTLQVWHLKQLTCHCLSSARSDWPCLISSLHPAQSAKTGDAAEKNFLGRLTSHLRVTRVPKELFPECHYAFRCPTLPLIAAQRLYRERKRPPELWLIAHSVEGKTFLRLLPGTNHPNWSLPSSTKLMLLFLTLNSHLWELTARNIIPPPKHTEF